MFTYRTYDIDKALASQPTTDTLKQNKDVALSFAAYFERKINGSVKTEAFKNNRFTYVNIRETNNPNLATNNALNSVQVLITECTRMLHLVIEYHLSNGQIEHQIVTSIKVPCGEDGIGGGDMYIPIAIISNPDPSLGNVNIVTNPPNLYGGGYQSGTYTLPNHWSIWNPNYDPSLFPLGIINIQQLATFSPQLQILIFTLGLSQTQID